MLKSISQFIKTLNDNEIVYCHWKSNEHLSEALDGDTDLDILFDYTQRNKLEKVFAECNLKRFRSTPLMQYNGIEDFIGFDKETAKIWHVHTHYRMTLGEKHLKGYTVNSWSSYLLERRIKDNSGIYVSNPHDEFVLLICRIALKLRWRDIGHKLGQDDIKEINWLKNNVSDDQMQESIQLFLGEKPSNVFNQMIQKQLKKKWQFRKLQKSLRKELKYFTSYNKITSWWRRTRREIFWFFGGIKRRLHLSNYSANRRISPSSGLVVAVLGSDGAGKSTTINYLQKEFGKKIDVVSVYLGSGDGSSSLFRKPMKIVAKKVGGKGVGHSVEKELNEKKKVSFKSRMYNLAKIIWAISLAKEKKTKLKKITKARNNGLLVITDRYPQTSFPGASDGPLLAKYLSKKGLLKKIATWEKNIYYSFSINQPDLAVKLVVPPEIAIERKPEMTLEEINNKKNIILNANISNNVAIIDTSRPFQTTIGEVMEAIWNLI